jgi:integrase/recombinase XerD
MLKEAVDTYLAVRRAAGFALRDEALYLNGFVRFATAQGETRVVAHTAITWAGQTSSEFQRATRLKAVIRFARFSRVTDSRHEIPPHGVFSAHSRRPTPYLFSDEEVRALMTHAAQLGPVGSLRPHTYSTLLGLLAATGLRISEALGLCFADITPDGLVIRQTKFRKSRLVPIHATTRAALDQYLLQRRQLGVTEDHLFLSRRHHPLRRNTVSKTFVHLFAAAGLPHQKGRRRPRLIDFRHTFASRALSSSAEGRDHIGRQSVALMTYLGHAHVSSTFWYLERSPQLLNEIAQACQRWIEQEGV